MVKRLCIEGQVQGVGFRPFVVRLATQRGLRGWVRNLGGGVEIQLEGPEEDIERMEHALRTDGPGAARIERMTTHPSHSEACAGFSIRPSVEDPGGGRMLPPDRPVCRDCLREMRDPEDPRFQYAFTHCTHCGPRYTVIRGFPIDRARTTMADFPLCAACAREYEDPGNRRFHAQLACCPTCGPRLRLVTAEGQRMGSDRDILEAAAACLDQGGVLAVKGVGGYHLMGDACSAETVGRIRALKSRAAKPLAVMLPGDPGAIHGEWSIPLPWHRALTQGNCAIVLVPRLYVPGLPEEIAPGLAEVGMLLPHSPLHVLLMERIGRPLVVTSANDGEDPILLAAPEAESRWAGEVDGFLHHDRVILRPADDPVVRVIAGLPRPVRPGRGNTPQVFHGLIEGADPLLAVGGDLKNTLALASGDRLILSPHLGTLGSPRSRTLFRQLVTELTDLLGVRPQAVICDAHPDARAARWVGGLDLPVLRVFHHHAHASAVYAESGLRGEMLVFAFDGLGYGPDGTLWGGEVLLGHPGDWRHRGGLRPFPLPGGDRAHREIWRCGLALATLAGHEWVSRPQGSEALTRSLNLWKEAPLTSSIGRLFDGAAALSGVCLSPSYEGEAAMRFESLAIDTDEAIELPLFAQGDLIRWDWAPLVPFLLDASIAAVTKASVFHASLALAVLRMAQRLREETGVRVVGLAGGVFQNRRLVEQLCAHLTHSGFETHVPRRIPINDAGLSVGQLVEAVALRRERIDGTAAWGTWSK